jgi:hypothetical protein
VPVISATTQRRHEAYFRREWSYAVDRARSIADGGVFILPVCIDDTPEAQALVPELFKSLHIVRVPDGEPPPEFLRRMGELSAEGRVSPLGEGLPASTAVAVDPEHPWLGLFSYSEETLAYFHGRDEETGELCRRVQRKPLTVLFGQSGLGKTSLLRAASCRGCARRATARSTCASTTRRNRRCRPSRSSRPFSVPRRSRGTGRAPARRSRASRSGSSCTTAVTCCAMHRARRSSRC